MDIKEKIAQANEKTVHMLMDSDPVWVDMKRPSNASMGWRIT